MNGNNRNFAQAILKGAASGAASEPIIGSVLGTAENLYSTFRKGGSLDKSMNEYTKDRNLKALNDARNTRILEFNGGNDYVKLLNDPEFVRNMTRVAKTIGKNLTQEEIVEFAKEEAERRHQSKLEKSQEEVDAYHQKQAVKEQKAKEKMDKQRNQFEAEQQKQLEAEGREAESQRNKDEKLKGKEISDETMDYNQKRKEEQKKLSDNLNQRKAHLHKIGSGLGAGKSVLSEDDLRERNKAYYLLGLKDDGTLEEPKPTPKKFTPPESKPAGKPTKPVAPMKPKYGGGS